LNPHLPQALGPEAKLTGVKAKIINGDCFWELLGKEVGGAVADAWMEKLTGVKASSRAYAWRPVPACASSKWSELMAGLHSAPCIAIGRLLDSDVIMTLPGFTPATNEACLAGCRKMRQFRQKFF
jgi:hypothetical protein